MHFIARCELSRETKNEIKFISQKKGLADQSKIISFDESIFIARCELSRETKNDK